MSSGSVPSWQKRATANAVMGLSMLLRRGRTVALLLEPVVALSMIFASPIAMNTPPTLAERMCSRQTVPISPGDRPDGARTPRRSWVGANVAARYAAASLSTIAPAPDLRVRKPMRPPGAVAYGMASENRLATSAGSSVTPSGRSSARAS